MLIKIINDDITLVKSGVIAHGVNCQGAMGSGVAKAIKEKWPVIFDEFKKQSTGKQMLGKAHVIPVDKGLWVANCYTQLYYGRDGKRYASLEAIQESLGKVFAFANQNSIVVSMPKIGCGLGGLHWDKEVFPVIGEMASQYDITVHIYEI